MGSFEHQKWRSGTRSIALIGTLPTGEMEELSVQCGNFLLMEIESFDGKAKAEEQGAVTLVLDLAKAFEWVSLPVVWA